MDIFTILIANITFLSKLLVPSFIQSRVFNGDPLRPQAHGYLVSLEIELRGNYGLCSGSIIDKNWIITSAHCFDFGMGMVTVQQYINETITIIGTVEPSKVIKHPAYINKDDSTENRRYDIALMKTAATMSFGKNVRSIELARVPPQVGHSAVIAGYGESGSKQLLPRKGPVKISKCSIDGIVCSLDKARAGSGDSGGALTSKRKLIGVTSGSCFNAHRKDIKKCSTVYTSVAANFDWIMSVTKSQ